MTQHRPWEPCFRGRQLLPFTIFLLSDIALRCLSKSVTGDGGCCAGCSRPVLHHSGGLSEAAHCLLQVLVAGVKVRWPCKAQDQFMEVAEACEGCDAAYACAWLVCHGSPHGPLLPSRASGQPGLKQPCPSHVSKDVMFAQRYVSAGKVLLLCPVAAEYPVAVMPNAKSFFPETHPRFIGTYWGQVSTPFTVEIVEVGRGTPAGPSGSAVHRAGTCNDSHSRQQCHNHAWIP